MQFKTEKITVTVKFIDAVLLCILFYNKEIIFYLTALFSCMLHELAHLTAFYLTGHKPKQLTVNIFGGKIVNTDILSYKDDLLISASGPFTNAVICIVSYILFLNLRITYFRNVSAINFGLFIFNILPCKPLDGERVLRCILETASVKKSSLITEKAAFLSIIAVETVFAFLTAYQGINITLASVGIYLIINLIKEY